MWLYKGVETRFARIFFFSSYFRLFPSPSLLFSAVTVFLGPELRRAPFRPQTLSNLSHSYLVLPLFIFHSHFPTNQPLSFTLADLPSSFSLRSRFKTTRTASSQVCEHFLCFDLLRLMLFGLHLNSKMICEILA